MNSLKRTARLAGLLYFVMALCGGFAQFFARGTVHVRGDAAATADNIVAHSALFRLGFVADLVTATSFVLLGLMLYRLFKEVNREVAAALVVFVAIGTGVILVNLLYHFGALIVATDGSYAAADSLVLLLLDMHQYGYTIAGILFGLWLFPLGYLASRSGMFPRALGITLMVACFSYLADTFTSFLIPGLSETVSTAILVPAVVAEFWMIGYLLLIGVQLDGARKSRGGNALELMRTSPIQP